MKKFSDNILEFNEWLANKSFQLDNPYYIINPFNGNNKEKIKEITNIFYKKYFDDSNKRYVIFGSSPARKGTSVTGIPFEDANHLFKETGIKIDDFYINHSSSNFLYDVITQYGGCKKFYEDFYMNFVCPLGIEKVSGTGNKVNANYYENKKLERALYDFMIESIKKQISFGIHTSACYCIGSGKNFKFLEKINQKYKFFDKIIPLEHPRFIMQYHLKDKEKYLQKYMDVLQDKKIITK